MATTKMATKMADFQVCRRKFDTGRGEWYNDTGEDYRNKGSKDHVVKTQVGSADRHQECGGTHAGSLRIAEVVSQLPPQLQHEVCSFAEYLLATRPRRKHGRMKLKWAGGLKEYRGRFTSRGLQKQSLAWWTD